jgi:hypothetical protein
MDIRRSELDLSIEDLSKFPIWEFAYGEKSDRILLKPSVDILPINISEKRYLVKAIFTLKNGLEKQGMIKPIDINDHFLGHLSEVDLSAIMITEEGKIPFWFGCHPPKRKELDTYYNWLGLSAKEIFPLQVSSSILLVNGIGEAILEGFMYCIKDEVEDFFHMKKSDIRIVY